MLMNEQDRILRRIDQLLQVARPPVTEQFTSSFSERRLGVTTLFSLLYGDDQYRLARIHDSFQTWNGLEGLLRGMRADVEAGLVGGLERRAVGEILADMLGLAREALQHGTDGSRNVAAVLTAAGSVRWTPRPVYKAPER